MSALFLFTLRSLLQRRRLLFLILLVAAPALLAFIFVLSASPHDDDGRYFAVSLYEFLILPVLLPLVALLLGASAFGNEIEDRTLIYLTLRPIARGVLVAAKWVAVVLVTAVLIEISSLCMYLIADHHHRATFSLIAPGASAPAFYSVSLPGTTLVSYGNPLGAILASGIAAVAAYCSIFLLLGLLLPRRGVLLGFIYVIVWEGIIPPIVPALATFSVRRYSVGILDAVINSPFLVHDQPATVGGGPALIVIISIIFVAGILCTLRLRRIELV